MLVFVVYININIPLINHVERCRDCDLQIAENTFRLIWSQLTKVKSLWFQTCVIGHTVSQQALQYETHQNQVWLIVEAKTVIGIFI